jgi:hypothetical protein
VAAAVEVLAARVRARLARGAVAAIGPVELEGGAVIDDAELAARVVLADATHCAWEERAGLPVWAARRDGLADDLRRLPPDDR